MGKPYKKGSPEAKAAIQRVRNMERIRQIQTGKERKKTPVTPEIKQEVMKAIKSGMSRRKIADIYKISYTTINLIASGVR